MTHNITLGMTRGYANIHAMVYLDTEGAAQRLGITTVYVRVLVNRGLLVPIDREGRRMRFREADLDAYSRDLNKRRTDVGLRKVTANLKIAATSLQTMGKINLAKTVAEVLKSLESSRDQAPSVRRRRGPVSGHADP